MKEFNANKKYESYKIPGQQEFKVDGTAIELFQTKPSKSLSLDDGQFYEIEYDSCPIPGVGKYVLKSQKIEEPKKDEIRELFNQMREIARAYRSTYNYSRFFDPRVQHDNSIIFYKQGMFMKDFSDNYMENASFNQYFPYYQMMGYEQLRTYFTWRTEVRKGNVTDISLSYAFLYIYELLDNIGVRDPEDGLNQLMSFWKNFREYNKSIDKYVLKWLKDYHIYYELPHTFKDFIDANNLTQHYPNMIDTDDSFDLFCSISKYDIRKSAFFSGDNEKLIRDCFDFVINRLRQTFTDCGFPFDKSVFQPTKKMSEWKPFKEALFYPWLKQKDRQLVLSNNEIYICRNNKWFFNTAITSESGRQLVGYIMKQMEVALRGVTKYKFKLSADLHKVNNEAIGILNQAGLALDMVINKAVVEFYKDATKTVVVVDQDALIRIRQEAMATTEKLIVPEQEGPFVAGISVEKEAPTVAPISLELPLTPATPTQQDMPFRPLIPVAEALNESKTALWDIPLSMPPDPLSSPVGPSTMSDAWDGLKCSLTPIEIEALSMVFHRDNNLKKYADACGIMLEVLVDGINEKAMDFIGDNLLDEEFVLYDDYKEQIKEMIK